MVNAITRIMERLNTIDRAKRVKLLFVLSTFMILSFVIGHIGPLHFHMLRYLGFALILPVVLIGKSLSYRYTMNATANQPTVVTYAAQPQQVSTTRETSNVPSNRSNTTQPYGMQPTTPTANDGQMPYQPYPPLSDPPPPYPAQLGFNPAYQRFPPPQQMQTSNQVGPLDQQNESLPPPPSYDDAVKNAQSNLPM